mmetsp:Transcript_32183/g.63709  ORF Transcript_32183/g.63709 Transcript_32183/m.63709 type:complete len:586 (+) Transcript_32183:404-2161(+)
MSSGDRRDGYGEDREWQHTLDLEAIARNQANNAISFYRLFEGMQNAIEKIRETCGINLGHKVLSMSGMADQYIPCLGCGLSKMHLAEVARHYFTALRACLDVDADDFLGVIQMKWKFDNNTTLFPSFQGLDRPDILPGECHIDSKNLQVKTWVKKIWDGECVYHIVRPGSNNAENGVCFILRIITTDDEMLMGFIGYSSDLSHKTNMEIDPALSENLDFNDMEILKTRAMHHFLRQYAFTIPAHLRFILLNSAGRQEMLLASSKKYKAEYLDWKILQADLTLNLPPMMAGQLTSSRIHESLMDVGLVMTASEQFEKVSGLYIEIGDTFKSDTSSYLLAANAYGLAGRGFENEALGAYLKQFRRLAKVETSTPDIKTFPYSDMIGNMCQAHLSQYEDVLFRRAKKNRRNEFNEDEINAVGFIALYRASKIADIFIVRTIESFFGFEEGATKSMLKEKFQKPKMAIRHLLLLTKSTSVQEYKKTLRAVLQPNAHIQVMKSVGSDETRMSDEMRKTNARSARKSANALVCKGVLKIQVCAHCHKWSDLENEYKNCPCHKISYCDNTCQKADWNRHKRFCSWRQKNKKK